MSRHGTVQEKTGKSDLVYQNWLVNMFINRIMKWNDFQGRMPFSFFFSQLTFVKKQIHVQEACRVHWLHFIRRGPEKQPFTTDNLLDITNYVISGCEIYDPCIENGQNVYFDNLFGTSKTNPNRFFYTVWQSSYRCLI